MNQRKCILFFEDQPGDGVMISEALAQTAMPVDLAVVIGADEALNYLHRRGKFAGRAAGLPVLVLLGISVRKPDGLELLRAVRKEKHLSHLPVVAFATSHDNSLAGKSYAMGVNSYIVKPVEFWQLVETLKSLVDFWTTHNHLPS